MGAIFWLKGQTERGAEDCSVGGTDGLVLVETAQKLRRVDKSLYRPFEPCKDAALPRFWECRRWSFRLGDLGAAFGS